MATQTAVEPDLTPRQAAVRGTAQMPKPMTAAQLDAILKAHAPGLRVYNPSDEWQMFEVHAIPYWLPPDLNGDEDPHPATGTLIRCTGVRVIRSRFLKQKDSSGKVIQGQTADAIVQHIVDPNNGGEMGVVFLPGVSKEQDEGLKSWGRAQWLKFQETTDAKILNARREFVANWKRNAAKKGEAVPPPSKREQLAIERAEERETVKEYRFECEVEDCSTGYATNDFHKYARHMKRSHGITVEWEKVEGPVEALSSEPVKSPSQDADAFDEADVGIQAAASDFAAKVPEGEVPFEPDGMAVHEASHNYIEEVPASDVSTPVDGPVKVPTLPAPPPPDEEADKQPSQKPQGRGRQEKKVAKRASKKAAGKRGR